MKIKGTFQVKMIPLEYSHKPTDGIQLARMSLDKTFEGTLEAHSTGEMLSAMTPVKGSAGYVAIEQVVGNLDGKKGSFVLQHFGAMSQDGQDLMLKVVPDSGQGQLKGLSGEMQISIEDGKHYYEFDYHL